MYRLDVIAAASLAASITVLGLSARSAMAADGSKELKAMFQSKYVAMNAAFGRQDFKSFMTYYTDDLVIVGSDGTVKTNGKTQALQLLERFRANYHIPKHFQETAEKVKGLSIADGGVIVTTDAGDTDGGTVDRDFWVRRGGHWRIKRHRIRA